MLRSGAMGNILISLIRTLCCGFRSRASLLAEILALRHQLAILKRSSKKRPRLGKFNRLLWYGSAAGGLRESRFDELLPDRWKAARTAPTLS